MDILALRKELGLSQEAFARRIGLTSKAHVCGLERDAKPSVRVALNIEKLSGGRITAASLNEDVRLVLEHRAEAANDAAPQADAA